MPKDEKIYDQSEFDYELCKRSEYTSAIINKLSDDLEKEQSRNLDLVCIISNLSKILAQKEGV